MSGFFFPSGSSAEYDITMSRISGYSYLGGVALQLLLLSAGEGEYDNYGLKMFCPPITSVDYPTRLSHDLEYRQ